MKNIKSIILIDDSELDLAVNKKAIENLEIPARVQTFDNAVDALNYLKLIDDEKSYYSLFAPQLILVDIEMPTMNGFEFLAEFDKIEIFKQRPIKIFLVSSSHTDNIKKQMKTA